MAKIGFIGMGNMGYAILNGLLKLYRPQDILFTDVNKERMEYVKAQTGVSYVDTNAELANQTEILFLAVKPQFYGSVLKNIKYVVKAEQIIVSIAPGITIESLKKSLGDGKRIVRAIPNTPALLCEGMTGVTYEKELFTIVRDAMELSKDKMRPGVPLREAQQAVIEFYKKALRTAKLITEDSQVGKYYYHGVSHSLGLDTHDPCDRAVYEPGMVLTNEPGLYVAEEGIGIRLENDILVTDGAPEDLIGDRLLCISDIENLMA